MAVYFELAEYRHLPMRVRIAWLSATNENEIRFGVECLDIDYSLHNGICDFLIYSKQWTPAKLDFQASGTPSLAPQVQFNRSVSIMCSS